MFCRYIKCYFKKKRGGGGYHGLICNTFKVFFQALPKVLKSCDCYAIIKMRFSTVASFIFFSKLIDASLFITCYFHGKTWYEGTKKFVTLNFALITSRKSLQMGQLKKWQLWQTLLFKNRKLSMMNLVKLVQEIVYL